MHQPAPRNIKLPLRIILIILLLFTAAMPAASAAVFELPVTIKTAFDKMTVAADRTTADKLKSGYSSMLSIQHQDIDWDNKINKLHYSNEENLLTVRQRIKDIDAIKLSKLQKEVEKTEEKYENLFAYHNQLTKQLSSAKAMKSKALTAVLQSQTDVSKIAVQLAKEDIKIKKTALKDAKTAASQKTKAVKAVLVEVDKLNVKIRSAKSTISTTKKQFNAETNALKTAARNQDTASSLKSLSRLNSHMESIIRQKKNIYSFEEQIKSVITRASAQL